MAIQVEHLDDWRVGSRSARSAAGSRPLGGGRQGLGLFHFVVGFYTMLNGRHRPPDVPG